ncbi:hypothetical protein NP493_2274g00002 [Ridgeia piscesae]|uniref:Uncharacterized protein n=1 Tax=Ridgeia piscesae TaxID=27915 RepID=A0AAD9JI70_RIDPI|nr:hypothetical protein NP493_2274g00002 [Ridgeia piscesae]
MQSPEDFNGTRKDPLPTGYRGHTRRELPEVFSGYTAVIWWTSLAAFVLSLIVLAAPGWASEKYRDNFNETDQPYDTKYSGLFVTDCAKRIGSRSPAGWVKAAQAMVFLAFFGSALAFAAGTCYLFVDAWNKKYVLYAFTAGSAVSGT